MSAARSSPSRSRMWTCSSSGISSRASARRSSDSSSATSIMRCCGRSRSVLARSAACSSEYEATSCSADCDSPGARCSVTSLHPAKVVGPFANGEALVFGRRRNSWLIAHSPRRFGSIAMSSITAVPLPSTKLTRRPSISASNPHLAGAGREPSHVDQTRADDLAGADREVTRPMERNTCRRPGISTTRPMTRGAAVLRYTTTTSRTLPSRSPTGSKTAHPARRAANNPLCAHFSRVVGGSGLRRDGRASGRPTVRVEE